MAHVRRSELVGDAHAAGAVGGLVLLHNLYSGAAQSARLALRWPAAAIAAVGFTVVAHRRVKRTEPEGLVPFPIA